MKRMMGKGRAALAAVAGCLALASVSDGQYDVNRPMPGAVQWANPSSGEHAGVPFAPAFDDHLIEFPNHPPMDQVPPMPMPNSDDWQPSANPDWSTTFHDAETGETYVMPSSALSGLAGAQSPWGDYKGVGEGELDSEWQYRGFGSMFQIGGDLSIWPRRGNVKLFMRFIDSNNVTRWFTCSGSMADSGVILTAAHCVYARSPNGINIFDWAEEVIVYPAWDGAGTEWGVPTGTEVIQNFGWARGTSYIAGSNYVNNGDFDSDCALVRINRGSSRMVGMLTGWFAWAWGGSCGFHQGEIYQSYSYPSENCGGGLHTGRDLYYWSGTWDSCPGNQLQMNTTTGCLTAVWGGMSGSGAYYAEGDNRYVHAVCSNSNRSTVGRYARQWETFINDRLTFETNTRGNTFDAELFQFRAGGSTTVQAGTAMNAGATVLVSNATNANPAADTYTLRVYLSTNNIISSGDTLLATWNYNWDFAAMQNVNFNVPAPIIPVNTTPGTYWIGAILDSSTDAFSGNNTSSTWDAQQISVTLGAPDAPVLVFPGNGSTNVSINADLDWNTAARATSYDVYFGTANPPPFVGNTVSSAWALPALSYNTQYFWRVVGRNTGGTTSSATWNFRTEPAPFFDLQANFINATAGTYFRGELVPIQHQVQNIGNATSAAYSLDVRASTNTIISTFDTLWSLTNYGTLVANGTRTVTTSVQVPLDQAAGNFYLGTIVNVTGDADAGNNSVPSGNTITIAICPPDVAAPWGVLDFFDIIQFVGWFDAADPRADLNNDNIFDFFDLLAYVGAFSAGCPR